MRYTPRAIKQVMIKKLKLISTAFVKYNSNRPNQLRGGPGSAGITAPKTPKRTISNPNTKKSSSIVYLFLKN
jgi:hypothetical protein